MALVDPSAEQYAAEATTPFEGSVAAAVDWTEQHSSSPQMMAGLAEARLLELLVRATRAKIVLEIGTFTGVGALSIAAALPPGGRLITLELDPETATVARRHIDAGRVADRVEIVVGPALDTLARLDGPFDLVWIDAAKVEYPDYWEAVLPKLAPTGVIAADNLLRGGQVLDPQATDPGTVAMREFTRRARRDPRVRTVLLTIGDGVLLAWPAPPETHQTEGDTP